MIFLDYIQSLPAWDVWIVMIVVACAVGITACGFCLALVDKSCEIEDLKEELNEKDKRIKAEQHDYSILQELYHNEVKRNIANYKATGVWSDNE